MTREFVPVYPRLTPHAIKVAVDEIVALGNDTGRQKAYWRPYDELAVLIAQKAVTSFDLRAQGFELREGADIFYIRTASMLWLSTEDDPLKKLEKIRAELQKLVKFTPLPASSL